MEERWHHIDVTSCLLSSCFNPTGGWIGGLEGLEVHMRRTHMHVALQTSPAWQGVILSFASLERSESDTHMHPLCMCVRLYRLGTGKPALRYAREVWGWHASWGWCTGGVCHPLSAYLPPPVYYLVWTASTSSLYTTSARYSTILFCSLSSGLG